MSIASINPATGETIQEYATISNREAGQLVRGVAKAWQSWSRTSFAERGVVMHRAAEVLRAKADDLARLMTAEMGKPISGARAEVEKCAWVCDYYADCAEHFLRSEQVSTDAAKSYVAFRPLGTVLAIMPWNFPFWQVFRFAAPALMAGNTGLLKHASNVPGCGLAIEQVFREAGCPEGVFRTLMIETGQTKYVIRNERVVAVTLTGSTGAGRVVAKLAGDRLKKTVLELGGSDPYVVLEDANLEQAVETCVASRLINSGQSCISAKRFIVVDAVRDAFERRFIERMRAARMGDPLHEDTQVGPLARRDLRDELHDQVERSVRKGARLALGGEIPDGPGAYYPPTVLTEVRKGTPAYEEELFGPVAAIIPVKNEKAAIRAANDSVFGLGAAVFTEDVERGERIARDELDAGACFVNAFVRSDPRLPFGGIKESGYGRELSHYGIREFVNIKTVYIA